MAGIDTLRDKRHQLSDLIHHLADNLEDGFAHKGPSNGDLLGKW